MEMRSTRGKNLIRIGWQDGLLRAVFMGGRAYEYSGVPEAEYIKLLHSPYPDRLFSTNIKGQYLCKQVSGPAPKAKNEPQRRMFE